MSLLADLAFLGLTLTWPTSGLELSNSLGLEQGSNVAAGQVAMQMSGQSSASAAALLESMGEVAPLRADSETNPGLTQGEPLLIKTRSGKRITLSGGCSALKPNYDLLIHFHGNPFVVEPGFLDAKINGALLVANLGIMSGPYERIFSVPGALDQLITNANQVIDDECGGHHKPARIALSGWSGGYGAIVRLLAQPKEAARIDAVLLADGLHVGFEPSDPHHANRAQLAPVVQFAEQAKVGQKLFAITHTEIRPPDYASTTQTANSLLESLGMSAAPRNHVGPRPSMQLTSLAEQGGFSIQGYAGEGPKNHCDHLYAIGKTLFTRLAGYWSIQP